MDIRNELMPVGIVTVNGSNGSVIRGMDLSKPAIVKMGEYTVECAAPKEYGFFLNGGPIRQHRTDVGLELMLGAGNSTDPFTRLVYQKYNLPNWCRVAAIVKFEMAESTAIEVRPVSSNERVATALAISELKKLPHSISNGEKIRRLVNRFRQFQVGKEEDLLPFVVPVYPVREAGQKNLSYRVFMVLVGWNIRNKVWRGRNDFEVITTSSPSGNNFVVSTLFDIDIDGMSNSVVLCQNRWDIAAKRAGELM